MKKKMKKFVVYDSGVNINMYNCCQNHKKMNGQIIQRDSERFTLYSIKGLAGAGVVVDNDNNSQSIQPITPQEVTKLRNQTAIEFFNSCFKKVYP
jgi:hypothetical protein